MENLNFETIHNVKINYKLAGIGPRFIAALLDSLIKLIILFGLMYIFFESKSWLQIDTGVSITISIVIVMIIIHSYNLLMEAFFNGQTLGKMATKIKVIKVDGSAPTFSAYLLRWLLSFFEIQLSFGSIGLVSIILTKNSQRIGDLAANTTVIKIKNDHDIQPLAVAYNTSHQVVFPTVKMLTNEDIEIASDLIKAYNDTEGKENIYKACELAVSKFKTKMEVSSELPPLIFLKTIIKDYQAID